MCCEVRDASFSIARHSAGDDEEEETCHRKEKKPSECLHRIQHMLHWHSHHDDASTCPGALPIVIMRHLGEDEEDVHKQELAWVASHRGMIQHLGAVASRGLGFSGSFTTSVLWVNVNVHPHLLCVRHFDRRLLESEVCYLTSQGGTSVVLKSTAAGP